LYAQTAGFKPRRVSYQDGRDSVTTVVVSTKTIKIRPILARTDSEWLNRAKFREKNQISEIFFSVFYTHIFSEIQSPSGY
jgi:hypothetical protein